MMPHHSNFHLFCRVSLGIVTGMTNPGGWDPGLYGVGVWAEHRKPYPNPYPSQGLPGSAEILVEFETQPCQLHQLVFQHQPPTRNACTNVRTRVLSFLFLFSNVYTMHVRIFVHAVQVISFFSFNYIYI